MQLITNRISTGKTKTFEDFVNDFKASKAVKTASVKEVVKTAEQDEADSSGQLDVEPLHQTGESTTMPKAGPSAKKEGESEGSESPKAAKEKDEADSSGQPEAEGKLTNDPKVLDGKEAEGEAEVKEAGELPEALKKHQFKSKKGEEEEKDKDKDKGKDKDKDKDSDNKVAGKDERGKRDGTGPFGGSLQDKEKGIGKRKERGEKCPHEDKDEDKDKDKDKDSTASSTIKFVKVANLDAKSKGFLKKYWTKLFGEGYANAMIADK